MLGFVLQLEKYQNGDFGHCCQLFYNQSVLPIGGWSLQSLVRLSVCVIYSKHNSVSQSCAAVNNSGGPLDNGQSNLADNMEDCSIGQSAVV